MTDLQDPLRGPSPRCLDERGGPCLEGSAPVWFDLDEHDPAHRAWLASERGIGSAHAALFSREGAWPRVRIVGSEQVLVALRVPSTQADPGVGAHALVRFWIEPARVITMAPRGQRHLHELHARLDEGHGPRSTGGLLLEVIELLADWLADEVLKLRPALLDLELEIDRSRPLAEAVRHLRRSTVALQAYADPHRDVLLRLGSLDTRWMMRGHPHDWHAVTDHYQQASRELDLLVERARALAEGVDRRTSDEMNRRIYILTVVSTIVLPLSLFASLLGANISTVDGNIVGMRHPLWIVAICAGMPLLGWLIFVSVRRWRGEMH